jgi:hypothetical protein
MIANGLKSSHLLHRLLLKLKLKPERRAPLSSADMGTVGFCQGLEKQAQLLIGDPRQPNTLVPKVCTQRSMVNH